MLKQIVLFFHGSLIDDSCSTYNELISSMVKDMPESERNQSWQSFSGVGAERTSWSIMLGLIHASNGQFNFTKTLKQAINFIRNAQIIYYQQEIRITIIGYSRGATLACMLANCLHSQPNISNIPINIFAIDPVPGPFDFMPAMVTLTENVKNYCAFIVANEHKPGFASCIPSRPSTMPEINYILFDGLRTDHSGVVGLQPAIVGGLYKTMVDYFQSTNNAEGASRFFMTATEESDIAISKAIKKIIFSNNMGDNIDEAYNLLTHNKVQKEEAAQRVYDYRQGQNPPAVAAAYLHNAAMIIDPNVKNILRDIRVRNY